MIFYLKQVYTIWAWQLFLETMYHFALDAELPERYPSDGLSDLIEEIEPRLSY